jgi:phage terminase large subunit-like protein
MFTLRTQEMTLRESQIYTIRGQIMGIRKQVCNWDKSVVISGSSPVQVHKWRQRSSKSEPTCLWGQMRSDVLFEETFLPITTAYAKWMIATLFGFNEKSTEPTEVVCLFARRPIKSRLLSPNYKAIKASS